MPIAQEQTVIRKATLWRANGWTLRKIAETLNKTGVPTKQVGQWFAQTVKDMVSNSLHHQAA